MRAFEVYLNGKKLCLAGIGDDGVLTATIVSLATREGPMDLRLNVGGTVSPTEEHVAEHVAWIRRKKLHVGDKVQVRLVETRSVHEPKTRKRRDPAKDLEAQKNFVREMAKQLGWKIQTTSRKKGSEPKSRRKK